MEKTVVHGAPGWSWASDKVSFHLSEAGGQVGAIEFALPGGVVRPYSLAPWAADACPGDAPVLLQVLRGDFFCFPFGESGPEMPPHGYPANAKWTLAAADESSLTASLDISAPAGRVTKRVFARPGETALYQEHTVSSVEGNFNYGYHPIVQFPDRPESCVISTAPFRFGSVHPGPFTNPAIGEASALRYGARFDSLESVPLAAGGTTDLTRYPAREGFEDLVMVSTEDPEFGWTAVTFPGYVWISLKNTRLFPSTLFWISNGGRPHLPWGGKHRRRMGIEDVNGYFCEGLGDSQKDLLKEHGVPTTGSFSANEPKRLPSIHVVAPVGQDAGGVQSVERDPSGQSIQVHFKNGERAIIRVDWTFLYS